MSLGEFASWEKFENFHEPPETVFRHNIKHIKVRGQMNFVHLQMPFQVIFHKTLLLIKIIGSALGSSLYPRYPPYPSPLPLPPTPPPPVMLCTHLAPNATLIRVEWESCQFCKYHLKRYHHCGPPIFGIW